MQPAEVTFASATAISVNGCFTSAYTNYLIVMTVGAVTAATTCTLKFRASGTDDTTTNYTYRWSGTTTASAWQGAYATTQANVPRIMRLDTNGGALSMQVFRPQASASTLLVASSTDTAGSNETYGATFNTTKSFDGFTITPGANSFGGTIRIYGYID
jgi:hypothetical protein